MCKQVIRTNLETQRLRLRLFTHDDLAVMHQLNTDPDVIRYADDPARDDLKIKKLIALIIPENIASIRVAEKLGMTKGPLIHIYGVDALQYEMML